MLVQGDATATVQATIGICNGYQGVLFRVYLCEGPPIRWNLLRRRERALLLEPMADWDRHSDHLRQTRRC